MVVEFTEPASIEIDDAISFYNYQERGFGKIFFEEVLQIIELISEFPELWPQNTANTRKATLKKFPYNLIYSAEKDMIYIIAVAHHHREPEYWIDRVL